MLSIVVILLVAMILVPLTDLALNERVRFGVKIGLYLLTTIYILYLLITAKVV